jgi:hypothetical protein
LPASSVTPSTPPGPAEQGLNASDQLRHGEWLGQIIIGAGIEPGNPVLDRIASGENQDRERLAHTPRRPEDGHTVAVGQTEVQHHGIVIGELKQSDGIGRAAGNVHDETRRAHLRLHDAGKPAFVLDHE